MACGCGSGADAGGVDEALGAPVTAGGMVDVF